MSLFRSPKPKKFNFIPRFYDPEKEALEDRLQNIKEKQNEDIEGVKARISGGFRKGHSTNSQMKKRLVWKSNIIILFIIVFLVILTFFIIGIYGLPEF